MNIDINTMSTPRSIEDLAEQEPPNEVSWFLDEAEPRTQETREGGTRSSKKSTWLHAAVKAAPPNRAQEQILNALYADQEPDYKELARRIWKGKQRDDEVEAADRQHQHNDSRRDLEYDFNQIIGPSPDAEESPPQNEDRQKSPAPNKDPDDWKIGPSTQDKVENHDNKIPIKIEFVGSMGIPAALCAYEPQS
ncbi:hypothetical protein BU23DRAFT_570568 [Bimuria novae-zelandiae CBS 107.79]|uniref:Uncharacterized protein n=1 Tax=Bimuria novae-zelandiae CBS 107.79 TaxID=1447943 RepID=A0A6A5V049_9PLEO|nr:hypothetical protein BU23DRAFT_570568 [Bimuria novae-zelandiae CBS 107.79]